MARYREPFTLIKRNSIWYYRVYDEFGVRSNAHSTGTKIKAEAKSLVINLISKGKAGKKETTFADYAEGFFDEKSPWVMTRSQGDQSISPKYIKNQQTRLSTYILPFFGKYRFDQIKPKTILNFRQNLLEEYDLSNKTVNEIVLTLKQIFNLALIEKVMTVNPLIAIKPLPNTSKKDAFTMNEVKDMFRKEWDMEDKKNFVFIAAVTGLRFSEICGIQEENIHDNYLDVNCQKYEGEVKPTKTKNARKIPLIPEIVKMLRDIKSNFKFPLNGSQYRQAFYKECPVKKEERDSRGLSIHSLRHFFNTYLLSENVSEAKVRFVMGHSSGDGTMTDTYSNWSPEMVPEVYSAQKKLYDLIA